MDNESFEIVKKGGVPIVKVTVNRSEVFEQSKVDLVQTEQDILLKIEDLNQELVKVRERIKACDAG